MEDSEEEDQYQDYDDQWSQDGSSRTYSDEDTGYGSPPWPGDGYSSSEPEYDLEEEPPDLEPQDDDQDNMSQGSWSEEEEEEKEEEDEEEERGEEEEGEEEAYGCSSREGGDHEDRSWCEENECENEEDEAERPQVEPWESSRDSEIEQEESWQNTEESDFYLEEPHPIYFSGHNHGPKAYLSWEKDMEEWFHAHQVQEEEKTTIAEDTLTEGAFNYWDGNVRFGKQDSSWEGMKRLLHKEFVDYARRDLLYYPSAFADEEPRRRIFATLPPRSPTPKKEETKVKPTVPLKGERLVPKARAKQSRRLHHKEKPLAPAKVATPSSNALRTPQAAPHQGKCSSSKKLAKPTCYRCHKRGHFAVNCSSKDFIKETSLGDKTESPKASDDIVPSDLSPNSSIMHLSFVKSVENHAGTREKQHEPPDGMKCGKETFTKEATLSLKEVSNKTWQGVIASTLIKEQPPDAHISRQKNFGQGKLLNPSLIQDTNLLYLGAGKIVSRSKPFQEGEYDEVIKSSYTKEPGINIPGEEKINRENTKETYNQNSVQTKVNIKVQGPINLCGMDSTNLEFNTHKNQPKRSSHEKAIEDTIWPIYKGPNEDMLSLKAPFRPNQKEPGYKPVIPENYTQQGILYNWNHTNSRSGSKVIQLLNRLILHLPYLESPGFKHLQTRLWRPGDTLTPSRGTPRGSGKSSISVPCTSISGALSPLAGRPPIPDVVTTNRPFQHFRTLSPPSSRSSLSGTCHHSRPRPAFLDCATTTQPFPQFRTLSPLTGRSRIFGSCHHYPTTLTLGAFTHQRIFLSYFCVLKTHPMNLDIPRHHLFPPKLSRLKPTILPPFSAPIPQIKPTVLSLFCATCSLFFVSLRAL